MLTNFEEDAVASYLESFLATEDIPLCMTLRVRLWEVAVWPSVPDQCRNHWYLWLRSHTQHVTQKSLRIYRTIIGYTLGRCEYKKYELSYMGSKLVRCMQKLLEKLDSHLPLSRKERWQVAWLKILVEASTMAPGRNEKYINNISQKTVYLQRSLYGICAKSQSQSISSFAIIWRFGSDQWRKRPERLQTILGRSE